METLPLEELDPYPKEDPHRKNIKNAKKVISYLPREVPGANKSP
jgi:hypothetical protein